LEGFYRFRVKASDGSNQVLSLYKHSPVVSSKGRLTPPTDIFENIKQLVFSEFGVEITLDNVVSSVYQGKFAWKVDLGGKSLFVSKDGLRLLKEKTIFLPVVIILVFFVFLVILLILFIRKKKRKNLI